MQNLLSTEEAGKVKREKKLKQEAIVFRSFSGNLTLKEYIENLVRAHCC